MSDGGWICLHRKILDWEWYDDANTFRMFVHMLLKANHEPKKWRGMVIKRGQFISSRAKLCEELGLSEQCVRTSVKKLISTNEITSEGTTQHTVFTVVKYEDYQDNNQQSNQRLTNEQPTANQRVTTNNNDNNENNKTRRDRAREKIALPPDFSITDEMLEWAGKTGLTIDLDSATERWKNSMLAKGSLYADWVAAWRNGMRLAQDWLDEKNPVRAKAKVHPFTSHPAYPRLVAKAKACGHMVDFDDGQRILFIGADGSVA